MEKKDFYRTFSQEKKDEVLAIALSHMEHDRFVQGSWIDRRDNTEGLFRGCFFGCMTQTDVKTLTEANKILEIPLWLICVSEKIFEGLPVSAAVKFPYDLIEAIKPEHDSEISWKSWNISLLTDQLRFVKEGSQQHMAILSCVDLFKMDEISKSAAGSAAEAWERSAAESAARSAVWSAWSAAESAESAVWSARSAVGSARSAVGSAESAVWSAESAESAARSAWSAAWSAARSAKSADSADSADSAESEHYVWMRDTLINILKSA